jgi:hypothetical protein
MRLQIKLGVIFQLRNSKAAVKNYQPFPEKQKILFQQLGNFIQQKVLSYLLQSTPNSIYEKTEK